MKCCAVSAPRAGSGCQSGSLTQQVSPSLSLGRLCQTAEASSWFPVHATASFWLAQGRAAVAAALAAAALWPSIRGPGREVELLPLAGEPRQLASPATGAKTPQQGLGGAAGSGSGSLWLAADYPEGDLFLLGPSKQNKLFLHLNFSLS